MELTFECPSCEEIGRVPSVEDAEIVRCSRCGDERELRRGGVDPDGALTSCLWCATDDLYLQKDFPQNLGLTIVLVGFVVSTIFWYFYLPIPAFAVLLLTAALDVTLYYLVKDVTICYRCLSQYRGPGTNLEGRFKPFDLAIGERYRQERIRIEELRATKAKES